MRISHGRSCERTLYTQRAFQIVLVFKAARARKAPVFSDEATLDARCDGVIISRVQNEPREFGRRGNKDDITRDERIESVSDFCQSCTRKRPALLRIFE